VLLLEYVYLCLCTHIYVLKILKFERQVFFIIVKYLRKFSGFNWF